MTVWQVSEIRRLWAEGKDTFDIAAELGIPESEGEEEIYRRVVSKRWVA